ncbi:MAG: methyl-accepting chemotaxis protein [Candidatus Goldiibacteriota bacterium]
MEEIIKKTKRLSEPSIWYKIGIPVIAGFLLFGYIIYFKTSSEMNKLVMEEFEGRIITAGRELAGSVSQDLYEAEEKKKELARIRRLREKNKKAVLNKPYRLNKTINESIKRAVESAAAGKDIMYVFLARDNKIIYSAGEMLNMPVQLIEKNKKTGGYARFEGEYEGEPVEEIIIPLEKNDEYLGEARLGFSLERVKEHIQATHGKTRFYSIAGTFIISGAVILLLVWLVVIPVKRLSRAAEAISKGEVDFTISESPGRDEVGRLNNSFAEMQGYIKEIAENAEKVSRGEAAMLVNMKTEKDVLGGAFRRLVDYIREMAEITEKIAQGDLTGDSSPKSPDDLMGNAFHKMIMNLRELVGKIIEQADTVTSSAEELSQIAEQSQGAVTQVAETISHITQAISQTAENAMNASTASAEANVSSKNGKESMNKLMKKMQSLQSSILHSTKRMDALSVHSGEISEILTVIRDISEQTKLLSFNAAIEAARAGHSGQGFAVVAEEVRKLSEMSNEQTKKIAEIIKEVKTDISGAVDAVNKGALDITEGTELAGRTQSIFEEIASNVEKSAEQVETIAAASQEIAASSQEAAATAQQQSAAVEEMTSSITQLADAAKELKESAKKFRV